MVFVVQIFWWVRPVLSYRWKPDVWRTFGGRRARMSRAIAESKDMELKIMLQTVANPDMIRKYAR